MAYTLCVDPQFLPVTRTLADALRLPVDVLTGQDRCGMVCHDTRRRRYYYDHRTQDGSYQIVSRYAEDPHEIDVYLDREFPTRQECQDMLAALMGMESRMHVKRQPELVGKWR